MATIEYFYTGHSVFAYIGHARFLEIAKAQGRRIDHRPFDLRKLVTKTGAQPMAERSKAHLGYFFGVEVRRWAAYRNVPILSHSPTHHKNDITRLNCLLIAGKEQGVDVDRLSHEMLRAHWVDDFDLDNLDDLRTICERAEIAPAPLLGALDDPHILDIYRRNTDEAIERSVFGAPTYFVDGEMFYGQDRLEIMDHTMTRATSKG